MANSGRDLGILQITHRAADLNRAREWLDFRSLHFAVRYPLSARLYARIGTPANSA